MAEPSSSAPISPLDEVVDAPGEVLPFLDATALPPLDELLGELAAQLAAWMPRQRWYAHKGATTPTVAVRGWAPLRVAPSGTSVSSAMAQNSCASTGPGSAVIAGQ